jgi:hypothetical protein
MTRTLCYSASAVVLLGIVSQAQAPTPPPKVLRIFEENVKVGKNAAHEKLETSWAKTWAAAKWPGQSLAMKTIAGQPQAWFIEPHDSMASIENLNRAAAKMTALTAQTDLLSAQDGELLTGVRTIIATYREDLSYLPANAPPVPKLRYFDVEIFQTRPGHTADFIESRKLTKTAHEKASMSDSAVYYAVAAGAPNGTFMRFRGVQSLADQDRYDQAHGAKAYQDAVSGSQKRIDELTSASVVNIQHVIFEFDPKMSFMSKEFTSIDPDFWTPKPKPAASAASGAGVDAKEKPRK